MSATLHVTREHSHLSVRLRADFGDSRRPNFAFVASALVVVLMVVESAVGLFVHGIYPEATWAVAALRGNDLVTLVLVAPALGVALARAGRSRAWQLVWLAGLFYSIYNFAYYVFGTAFNDIFLLHVATFSLSIASAVALASGIDVDGVAARTLPHRSDRVVAAFMCLVGLGLIAAWGGISLRFAFTDTLPHNFMPPSAVHLVYAIDMSLLAPAFLAGGVLLWQRRAWGYVLGVAVNLSGAAYLTVLEFVGGFESNAGVENTSWVSPPAIGGALLCGAAAIAVLRRLDLRT